MSKQEPGGHNEGSTVPASNRRRQEDQTYRKNAVSKRPETRSGARHVHFETPQIHGDHSGNRRVREEPREEPRDTHRHREDNRRQCGDPLSGMRKSQDQMAKHTDRERSKENSQRRTVVQHLRDSKGITETAYDLDRPVYYETRDQYEEALRRYLSAIRHRAASGGRQRPDSMQRFTLLLIEDRPNQYLLPTKALRLQYLQSKRENEIMEEKVVLSQGERLSSILSRAMDRGHNTLIKLWDKVEQAEGKCTLCERLCLGSILMILLDSLHTAIMLAYAGAEQGLKDQWVQVASTIEERLVSIAGRSGRARDVRIV